MAFLPPPPGPPPEVKVATPLFKPNDNPDQPARQVSSLVQKRMASLSWRTGRGAVDSFNMEVDGLNLDFAQRTSSEVTGFGTGGNIWNGAIVLSKYLEKKYGKGNETDEFRGKNVLEIGSGTGVGGIVCAHFWKGANFVLTDQEQVLPLINENIKRNSELIPCLKSNVSTAQLDWGPNVSHLSPPPPYDWVIACECVAPIFRLDLLLQTLLAVTDLRTTILMSYEHRHDSCRKNFFEPAGAWFAFHRIPDSDLHEKYQSEDIELYLITRHTM